MPRPLATVMPLILTLFAAPAFGQLSPPVIRSTRPVGAAPGQTIALEVGGADLDGASRLWFEESRVRVEAIEAKATTLKARVTAPAGAAPGPLRFRVVTPKGLSNPGVVFVGRDLPAVAEVEPNNAFRRAQAVAPGVAVDGVIAPGDDVDVFAVELAAGETLVAEAVAARAGSGLDPLVTVFGPDGRELAWDDDAFGRDAAVAAVASVSGRHLVQIQDANGRNRDNNIEQKIIRPYRLEIGKVALVTSAFPPGLRRGGRTGLRLQGANLGAAGVGPYPVDVPPDAPVGDLVLRIGTSNGAPARVGEGPEVLEVEPNDDAPGQSQAITVPGSVNGALSARRDGDTDVFRLRAGAGREGPYRVTVFAARVGSPADPVLTVLDAKGDPQGEDDDALGRDAQVERPIDAKDGLLVSVRDYYGRGGDRFVYRLEVEPGSARGVSVKADLGLRTVPRGGSVALPLALTRRDYDGPVTVLAGELPAGVTATPVTVPAKGAAGLLIVSARPDAPVVAFPLRLTARDAPATVEFLFRERVEARDDPADPASAALAVSEPAGLSVRVEPADVVVPPGGRATVSVVIERRGEAATKAAVKVRLAAAEGNFEGLDAVPEATIAAGAGSAAIALKARPDAAPARRTVTALARFESAPEPSSVASAPVSVVVPAR